MLRKPVQRLEHRGGSFRILNLGHRSRKGLHLALPCGTVFLPEQGRVAGIQEEQAHGYKSDTHAQRRLAAHQQAKPDARKRGKQKRNSHKSVARRQQRQESKHG